MIGSSGAAPLRIAGAVGKASTGLMIGAVFAESGRQRRRSVVVLSPHPDAEHTPWRELLADLDTDSVAVLTADHGGVFVPEGSPATVITFGLTSSAQFLASDVDATLDGTSFTLHHGGERTPVRLRLLGEHQVVNALAALALAYASGVPMAAAISALEGMTSLGRGRMELVRRDDDIMIVNDAISALPLSVTAALKTLALISGQRRSVAVLGELETEEADSREVHDRIGRLVVRLNVKKLIVVGHDARHIHNAAGLEGSWDGESVLVDTPEEAYDLLREEVRSGDVVLVKSSKQAGLGALADRLTGGKS